MPEILTFALVAQRWPSLADRILTWATQAGIDAAAHARYLHDEQHRVLRPLLTGVAVDDRAGGRGPAPGSRGARSSSVCADARQRRSVFELVTPVVESPSAATATPPAAGLAGDAGQRLGSLAHGQVTTDRPSTGRTGHATRGAFHATLATRTGRSRPRRVVLELDRVCTALNLYPRTGGVPAREKLAHTRHLGDRRRLIVQTIMGACRGDGFAVEARIAQRKVVDTLRRVHERVGGFVGDVWSDPEIRRYLLRGLVAIGAT